ncbi:MAG: transcriptional activator RfaH [Burkholderiaceae bacterium]|nr:MAG: transcriptional activator RfaH [Burkholderiaceae bacterium]
MKNNSSWYVVYTKPRQEKVALENLLRQSYQAYLPQVKTVKRARNQIEPCLEPMFPRYCFFRPAHSEHSVAPANSTFGVLRLVRFGVAPATVDSHVLDQIRVFEQQQNTAEFSALAPYKAGQRVLVDAGPLKGLEGLVSEVAEERVIVLLNLLGRESRIAVPPDWISAA